MRRSRYSVESNQPSKQRWSLKNGVDMTPMVDVTFLLLIFFMVTASFSLQKSIAMPTQPSELPGKVAITQDEQPVEIQIDSYGSFLVLTKAGEIDAAGKKKLVETLKSVVEDDLPVRIVVHRQAKLRWLVDAMDAATIAGFEEVTVKQVDNL